MTTSEFGGWLFVILLIIMGAIIMYAKRNGWFDSFWSVFRSSTDPVEDIEEHTVSSPAIVSPPNTAISQPRFTVRSVTPGLTVDLYGSTAILRWSYPDDGKEYTTGLSRNGQLIGRVHSDWFKEKLTSENAGENIYSIHFDEVPSTLSEEKPSEEVKPTVEDVSASEADSMTETLANDLSKEDLTTDSISETPKKNKPPVRTADYPGQHAGLTRRHLTDIHREVTKKKTPVNQIATTYGVSRDTVNRIVKHVEAEKAKTGK